MPLLEFTCAAGYSFQVRAFHADEGLSRAFVVDLTLVSRDASADLGAVVGKPASFHVDATYGGRTFEGVCSSATRVRRMADEPGATPLSTYTVTLVPRLWLLTQRTNHRTFQHLSIPDIADALFAEWGIEPVWRIDRGTHPKLELKVQYGESDYDFLNRLLEEAGIAYVLADADGGTALVLSDDLDHLPVRSRAAIPFVHEPGEGAAATWVTDLSVSHDVRPAAHQIVDYDFRKPAFPLRAVAPPAEGGDPLQETYEYRPTGFRVEGGKPSSTPVADDKGVARHEESYGKARAARHLDAHRTGQRLAVFRTNVVDLLPGVSVQIDHAGDEFAKPVLVVGKTLSGSPGGEWRQAARALFKGDPVHPPLRTPKPRLYAVQTATVVGPKGQEIHCDEHGRVRAQFPWDRAATGGEDSGPWMRVSQGWTGAGFGTMHIPRVGQEVLVAFLDGDPDAPIIVGRVYNAIRPVPYKLPENKTQSGWKSQSSPGGGGYNEIMFEDAAGRELVRVQAEKDLHKLVKNDEQATIGNDEDVTVVRDASRLVGNNLREVVGMNRSSAVGVNATLEVGEKIEIVCGKSRFVMDKDGNVTLQGVKILVSGSGHVQVFGDPIDLN